MISLIQHFEADFLWKVSLKILNSGIILKTFTHGIVKALFACDKVRFSRIEAHMKQQERKNLLTTIAGITLKVKMR